MVMEDLAGDDESHHYHLLVLVNTNQLVLDTMITLAQIPMIPNLQHIVIGWILGYYLYGVIALSVRVWWRRWRERVSNIGACGEHMGHLPNHQR
ncbi:hypothetical protein R1flu_017128 [Riccia fluitans]|uniref:Uncharacterized protein n=1 Tax=Riccia fluitans TaxID=41844 RepID=A0ABD1YRT9_9MARC